jgi:hypothetical protein
MTQACRAQSSRAGGDQLARRPPDALGAVALEPERCRDEGE